MLRFLILFILLFLTACSGQSKEELLQEGNGLRGQGNFRGAIVLYKSALEKDANFLDARKALADTYLSAGNLGKAENEFKKVQHQNPSDSSLLLKLATVYLQQNKPQKSLLELDRFHSTVAETADSLSLYGRAHGAAGDLEAAGEFFKKARMLDPGAIEPRLYLAKVYLQKNETDRARSLLTEILEQDNKYIQAYYLLAGIETRLGRRDEALKVYQDLVQVKPKELHALYMIGMLQMDKGEFEEAQKAVDKILSMFKDRPEGTRLQGMLLYRQGQYEKAIIALGASLKQQQHLLSYFFLGLSYYGLDQLELALNQFQKALDLQPEFERARVMVSMTLLKQKRVDDSIVEIQKVLRNNPDNAFARNILGSAYLAQGDYDKGMAELEIASELDPSLSDAHLKRGMFHLAKGESAQGEEALIKAVEVAPEVLNSRLMLTTHYLRQKNYPAAVEVLKEGMNGTEIDALLNNYLAAAYFPQKKNSLAVAALNDAKKANPGYLTPYFNLASYYASESQYEKAIAEYQAVVERDAKNIRALLGLAAIYGVQGQDDKVDDLYKQLEATGTEDGFGATSFYRLKLNQPTEALAVVNRGLVLYPESAGLLEVKGRVSRQLGQNEAAEEAYIKLSSIEAERGSRLLLAFYLQTKQPKKAESLIESALNSDSQKDYPYLLSASYLMVNGKNDAALKVLQKGIGVVSNPLRLQMQLASVYEASDDTLKAESIYQRIIDKSPRFAAAYTALGYLKEKYGDKGQALELYRSAIKHDRKNFAALNNAAFLLVDNFGQPKDALELAMSAYRLKPADPRIMDTLGYVLLKNERSEDSLVLLEKAAKLLPEAVEVKLHLAMVKSELGKKSEAKELLGQVIASGDKKEVEQAKALLKLQ